MLFVVCQRFAITAQKMKLSLKDFFSKCGQIRRICTEIAFTKSFFLNIYITSLFPVHVKPFSKNKNMTTPRNGSFSAQFLASLPVLTSK